MIIEISADCNIFSHRLVLRSAALCYTTLFHVYAEQVPEVLSILQCFLEMFVFYCAML